MNLIQVAHALRALAAAIEAPDSAAPAAQASPTVSEKAAAPSAPTTAPKPRGRPPKGVEGAPAAPAAAPATPAVSAPAATPAPASASGLTHAQLVPAFKAAAVAHGAEFVRGLLKTHGAATFDKVKDLDTFAAQLKAGPVAAPAANAVDDLLG